MKTAHLLSLVLLGLMSPAAEAESGFATVPGGRLYYEATGDGDPIVLIHGNAGDHRHWDAQVDALSKVCRVIRYDVRGFGQSTRAVTGQSYSDYADLAALFDYLGIKSAHVAGWSMGAAIAADFALAYPERARSLISIGPWVSGHTSAATDSMLGDMSKVREVLRKEGQPAAVRAWMEAPFFATTIRQQSAGDTFRDIARDYAFSRTPPEPLRPSAIGRLAEIRVPTLIMTAEHDIPACLEVAARISDSVPGARKIVMSGTGHLLHMEKPDEFNRHIASFIAEVAKAQK